MDTEKLALEIVAEMEMTMEKLKSPEVVTNFDSRCIAIARTKLEEAQLWFANSRK